MCVYVHVCTYIYISFCLPYYIPTNQPTDQCSTRCCCPSLSLSVLASLFLSFYLPTLFSLPFYPFSPWLSLSLLSCLYSGFVSDYLCPSFSFSLSHPSPSEALQQSYPATTNKARVSLLKLYFCSGRIEIKRYEAAGQVFLQRFARPDISRGIERYLNHRVARRSFLQFSLIVVLGVCVCVCVCARQPFVFCKACMYFRRACSSIGW